MHLDQVSGPKILRALRQLQILPAQLRSVRGRLRGDVDMDKLRRRGVRIGDHVYLAPWVMIDAVAPYLVEIGDGTIMAPGAQILTHDAGMKLALDMTRIAPVTIGRRVYVGAGALILPGVTVGDEAIVGAASVVTRDVPPGMLAVGNPARVAGSASEYIERQRVRLANSPTFTRAERDDPAAWPLIRERIGSSEGYIP